MAAAVGQGYYWYHKTFHWENASCCSHELYKSVNFCFNEGEGGEEISRTLESHLPQLVLGAVRRPYKHN